MTTLYIDLDDNNLCFSVVRNNSTSIWGTSIAYILQDKSGIYSIKVPNFVAVPLNLIPESFYNANRQQIIDYLQTHYPEYLL